MLIHYVDSNYQWSSLNTTSYNPMKIQYYTPKVFKPTNIRTCLSTFDEIYSFSCFTWNILWQVITWFREDSVCPKSKRNTQDTLELEAK